MNFIHSNGSSPIHDPDFVARFCNCVLEQLCLIRVKVELLDKIVVSEVLNRHGITNSKLFADERQKVFDELYDRACAEVLKQIEGNWPDSGQATETEHS